MRAVLEIAQTSQDSKPQIISHIANSQEVSLKYLESLLVQLRNEGILQSIRGKNGGYLLGREPELITVFQIIEALDGPMSLVNCHENGKSCHRANKCSTAGLWDHLTRTLSNEMKKITLKDLMTNQFLSGELL